MSGNSGIQSRECGRPLLSAVQHATLFASLLVGSLTAGQVPPKTHPSVVSNRRIHSGVVTPRRPPIVLISVDTLRADRLGCYSPAVRKTPNIDALSNGGTLFSQVSSQIPLTLPSHVSMFTSTYPFVNGVQDNGDYLPSNSVTLATILKSNGYQTAAFVSSFVLDRRFGLDQGFNTYDSPEDLEMKSSDPGDIKRPDSEVVRAGTEWLKAHLTERFFLFLHLYDLHTPRSLSAADKARYGDGYDSEIAYVDDQIGKFLKFLAAHRLLDKSLIVFVSDHGESLGEHGENTHGFFIYQSTLHVPFIVHWPTGSLRLPPIINSPASLIDVVPTILGAAGIPIPATLQGTNLLKSGQTSSDIYSESIYPNRHFGTSMLASLRQGHYKYIDAPKPEFFDLAEDPQETNNLYNTKASVASAYRERIKQLRAPYHTSKK